MNSWSRKTTLVRCVASLDHTALTFSVSPEFRRLFIMDIPSRIHPVFLNLVNNAAYWVSLVDDREIRLDFRESLAIIADSGPGVDPHRVKSSRRQLRAPFHSLPEPGRLILGHYRQASSERRE